MPDSSATPHPADPKPGEAPGLSRLNTAWVRPAQAKWLREVRAAALLEGVAVSASDIIRLALDQLRRRGSWQDLRDELLTEYRSRATRKPRS